jgi:hypothetical protein
MFKVKHYIGNGTSALTIYGSPMIFVNLLSAEDRLQVIVLVCRKQMCLGPLPLDII